MKKIIITAVFSIFALLLVPAQAPAAQEPADLVKLTEAGLSDETIGRYLSQTLMERAAPPLDSQFLKRLGQYGGDHLARTYLELDKVSAHQKNRKLSPQAVDQMIKAKTPPAEIQMIIGEEISRYENEAKKAAAQPLMPPALPPSASADSAPPARVEYDLSSVASLAPRQAVPAQPLNAARLSQPVDPQIMVSPRLPEPAPRPAGFQDLRPGQAADPASRQSLPYSTYDIRNNRSGGDVRRHNPGPWMGVVEKELPDGHLVEAHSIGQSSQVGQEVYARPSGHKVYRYYSGNPDAPHSGTDVRQEAVNRDNLNVIFQNRRN